MHEERLTELETRVAFQEHTIHELSDEIYRQQKQITHLEQLCKLMLQKLQDVSADLPGKPVDEKPPHY